MNIQEILSSRNIAKVIYVDDELNKVSFYDNAIAKIRVLLEEGTRHEKYPFLSNSEIWEESFNTWWANATFDDVIELSKTYDIQRRPFYITNQLHNVLPESFPIDLLAPEQFNDDFKGKLIQELTQDNKYAIILVDYELDGYDINGDQLLVDIANCKNVFCGIFSQTFDISDEIEQWRKRAFPNNVYPISKKRFEAVDADNEIEKGIKHIIWLKQLEDIKRMANQLAFSASETLKDGLKEIDPATFDRLIISSSIDEGCWEFDLLSRIIQVYLNRGIKAEMKKQFSVFQRNTNSLRDFHDDSQNENVNKDILVALERDEAYDDIEYINSVFSAVSNGDIFQIGNRYYILLGQPCNLSIRDEGREEEKGKRNYKLDQAFVLPLIKDENKAYCEKLLYPFNDEYVRVSFPNRQRISLTMLDLVAYNATGEAIIDLNIDGANLPGHEIMQDNLLRRYDFIREKIITIKQSFDLASKDKNKDEKLQLAKYFCRPFEMGDEIVAKKPKHEDSKLIFNVKRVGRYNSYGAHVLLQQFMSYLSRPEFPAKFDRC